MVCRSILSFYITPTIKFFLFRFVKSRVKECHRFPDTHGLIAIETSDARWLACFMYHTTLASSGISSHLVTVQCPMAYLCERLTGEEEDKHSEEFNHDCHPGDYDTILPTAASRGHFVANHCFPLGVQTGVSGVCGRTCCVGCRSSCDRYNWMDHKKR